MMNFISSKLVGTFIKQRRQTLGLSQKALGQLLEPVVTTQFISNLERGVTPLPLTHVPTLAKVLKINEADLTSLLEKEYAQKLSKRLGIEVAPGDHRTLDVSHSDYDFMKSLYEAYRNADSKTKQAFLNSCENLLWMLNDCRKASSNIPIPE